MRGIVPASSAETEPLVSTWLPQFAAGEDARRRKIRDEESDIDLVAAGVADETARVLCGIIPPRAADRLLPVLDVVRHHGPHGSELARADQLPQGPVRRPPPPLIGDRKQRPPATGSGNQLENFRPRPSQRLLAQHGDFAFEKSRRLLEMELGRRTNKDRVDPRQRDEVLKSRTNHCVRSQRVFESQGTRRVDIKQRHDPTAAIG